jgi:hypothetical protein
MGPDNCFQVTGINRHALVDLLSQVNNLTLKIHGHLLLSVLGFAPESSISCWISTRLYGIFLSLSKKKELEKSLGSSSKVSLQ